LGQAGRRRRINLRARVRAQNHDAAQNEHRQRDLGAGHPGSSMDLAQFLGVGDLAMRENDLSSSMGSDSGDS
jgi:hypothetical protein